MGGDIFRLFHHLLKYSVSIHAPAWGATYKPIKITQIFCFNPRPRMGGDISPARLYVKLLTFQSTPPHGGRPISGSSFNTVTCFNPRPRMGGDSIRWDLQSLLRRFQSTPPHGGRPFPRGRCITTDIVSIHAPAWGATHGKLAVHHVRGASIHAPAWGATFLNFA